MTNELTVQTCARSDICWLHPVEPDELPLPTMRIKSDCLDEATLDDEELGPVAQEVSVTIAAAKHGLRYQRLGARRTAAGRAPVLGQRAEPVDSPWKTPPEVALEDLGARPQLTNGVDHCSLHCLRPPAR